MGQFHNPAQREKPAYLGDEIQIDFLKKFAPQSLQVLSSQIEPIDKSLVRLPISVMIKKTEYPMCTILEVGRASPPVRERYKFNPVYGSSNRASFSGHYQVPEND